jgi:alanine racemase
MLGRYRNSYAEINLKALEHNFNHLKSMVNGAGIVPMVKANAYGHGEIQVSRVVERLGARYLGMALIEEGIALREAGVQAPILFFGFFDALGAEALIKYRLTPVLSSFDQIEKLKASLTESDHFPVHIEFNTGMQRNGFEVADAAKLVDEFDLPAHLKLEICWEERPVALLKSSLEIK